MLYGRTGMIREEMLVVLEQKVRITKVWICTVFGLYSSILSSQLLAIKNFIIDIPTGKKKIPITK